MSLTLDIPDACLALSHSPGVSHHRHTWISVLRLIPDNVIICVACHHPQSLDRPESDAQRLAMGAGV